MAEPGTAAYSIQIIAAHAVLKQHEKQLIIHRRLENEGKNES